MNLSENGRKLLFGGIAVIGLGVWRMVYNFIKTGQPVGEGLESFLMVVAMCAAVFMLMVSWRVE